MSGWIGRLSAALGTFGYQTLFTDTLTLDQVQAIGIAQQRQRDQRVDQTQAGDWAAVLTLLHQLAAIGARTASVRFEYILHLVLGCAPVHGVAIAQVQDFRQVVAPWLHALQAALPREKLNDSGKAELAGLLSSAGVGGVAASLITSMAEGPTAVDCLMVFPVVNANPDYIAQWQSTDLVSEPLEDPGYRCWLWTTDDNAVYPSGHARAESGRDMWRGHVAAPADLARALRSVPG